MEDRRNERMRKEKRRVRESKGREGEDGIGRWGREDDRGQQ